MEGKSSKKKKYESSKKNNDKKFEKEKLERLAEFYVEPFDYHIEN